MPGLIDAFAAHNVLISNAPGAGVLEAPAMQAFLPALAKRLLGEKLLLPNIATWWCGDDAARAVVEKRLGELRIAPAFGGEPARAARRARCRAPTCRTTSALRCSPTWPSRPQDYVGQEMVRLSTMPVVADSELVARPFTLARVRGARPRWRLDRACPAASRGSASMPISARR